MLTSRVKKKRGGAEIGIEVGKHIYRVYSKVRHLLNLNFSTQAAFTLNQNFYYFQGVKKINVHHLTPPVLLEINLLLKRADGGVP